MRRFFVLLLVGVLIANIGISVAQAALTTALLVAETRSDDAQVPQLSRDLAKICQAFNRTNPVNSLDPTDGNPLSAVGNPFCLYCVPGLDDAPLGLVPEAVFSHAAYAQAQTPWAWLDRPGLNAAQMRPLGPRAPPVNLNLENQ